MMTSTVPDWRQPRQTYISLASSFFKPSDYKEHYVSGSRVWIPDTANVWRCAELNENFSKDTLSVSFEDGNEVKEFPIKGDDDLPPLRNPDILIGENDLTSLSYLHEPAVLYNLQVRFCDQNSIYTYCGIVLVAINPYNELPIYGADTIGAYRGQAMGDLDPHIFAVAEEAFTKMERENRDQSIIVSGESGAGKTVSAKYAMRYFATVGGSFDETQVEKKILASNPIMEAIGNAKTTRNDNSSRFGKYIELDFTKNFHIMGANMRTYLLEKSRVVFQATDERNYHIFYQLCSVSSEEKWAHLLLERQASFHYLNQGDNPTIEGVDDKQNFIDTCKAFNLLGINDTKQEQIFRVLAAILHLGNIELLEGSGDSCVIEKKDGSLQAATKLLGIAEEDMRMWLCNRKITSGREVFTKPMTIDESTFSRDALAKCIYSKVFEWIVYEINKCFACSSKPFRFIGVLDIYGFETFQVNSFEQFCINYANEKLQQQFNQHVFKLEQEEYVKEKIEWNFINFYDNQPCIDLIESKLGILDLLDEECKMPKGSDHSWVEKLYDKCQKWEHFSKPRLSNTSFMIRHFADTVAYESAGFLEKNRDNVSEECLNVLQSSQISLVKELFSEKKSGGRVQKKIKVMPTPPSKAKQMKRSVGSQFRESLSLLMVTLNATTPHYVRCIKPNDDKLSFTFDPVRAIQQLRACGVLETVRISAAGYPSRWTYHDFFTRYRVLCKSFDVKREDLKLTCEKIISNMINDEDKFKFGRTKIFFRAGQVAYMEKLRADRLRACGIMIQKHVKGFLHRKKYLRMRTSVLIIQKFSRGFIARSRVRHLRRQAAATKIEACVRGWVKRIQYRRLVYTITQIQAYARGKWARQKFVQLCRIKAALIIQKNMRRYLAVQRYRRISRGILAIQGRVKVFLARKQLRQLKIEAKTVEHQRQLNKGLENKIISLQHKLNENKLASKEIPDLKEEIVTLKSQVSDFKSVEGQLKVSNNKIVSLQDQIKELTKCLEVERSEKMDILTEKEKNDAENQKQIEQLNADNIRAATLLREATDETILLEGEEKLRQKFATEKQLLLLEYQEDKASYQNLLKEYNKLEIKCEQMEREICIQHGITHKRSGSNLSNVSDATTEIAWDETSDVYSVATDEDRGYGSVRSRLSNNTLERDRRLDTVEWDSSRDGEISLPVPEKPVEDVSLVLKLQKKVRELDQERTSLHKRVELLETASPTDDPQHAQEMIRLQELEMENAKIKDDLRRIRKSIADSEPHNVSVQEYMKQFESLQDELERRREECIQLRTVLANRATELRSFTQTSYGKDVDIVNEDGEVVIALQAQKQINKQLVNEMQSQKDRFKKNESDSKIEMDRLRQDNERQQDLIGRTLAECTGDIGPSEVLLQSEVMRLTSENLNLQGHMDTLNEQVKKYKRAVKVYSKKLKEAGGGEPTEIFESEPTEKSTLPVIRKKDREYMGMLEYDHRDEMQIIRVLIYELKPRVAVTLLPGLPAYILFMCIRHTDHTNDDDKVRSLLNNIVNGIKRVIKKRHEDLDSTVLWLSNTLRLLHTLKQYSDEKAYQTENTAKQNEQFLKNFDLSEYRTVLSDIAVWIYNGVIKLVEEKVQPLIVPAVLEHEAITGLSGNKPGGMRGRTGSVAKEIDSPVEPQKALDELMKELTQFYRTLALFGTDPEILTQVFRQIFYFICAGALNNLLLRKDMCHWSKGMQIRYNLSHLEQWTRDMKLQETGVTDTLAPIIQAAQLLQARKTDDDVNSICDMCDKLTVSQIIKILNLYTPADDYEERVPISFINKIQSKLQERAEGQQAQAVLLMNSKFAFPVRFPFNPSSIRLEDIEIPESLSLKFLKKL